ncbi:MAG: HD domain-containing protein [Gammaproteobacteria bacterium]|nr:HD domain-containing protein [Gammaproteobacteria bacterium]
MQQVSFRQMRDGTKEDYAFLDKLEKQYISGLPDRLMAKLADLEHTLSGYQVTRLEHSLQSASRAYRDGRSEQYVVACLLHDVGDDVAPYSHSELAAAILRPYVEDRIYWIIKHHGVFQLKYYGHHVGVDPDSRDQFNDHPLYHDAIEFCEKYDQNCFDPDYESFDLEFFRPMVESVFGGEPLVADH